MEAKKIVSFFRERDVPPSSEIPDYAPGSDPASSLLTRWLRSASKSVHSLHLLFMALNLSKEFETQHRDCERLCHSYLELNFVRSKTVRSGQVVILKARPVMDAAVMSFHLSLFSSSYSRLTWFLPVVMPYNDNPALSSSFQIQVQFSCSSFQLFSMRLRNKKCLFIS